MTLYLLMTVRGEVGGLPELCNALKRAADRRVFRFFTNSSYVTAKWRMPDRMLIRELLPNLAIVAIATSVWTLNRRYAIRAGDRWSTVIFSVVMTVGILGTMSVPFEFRPGVLLDVRYSLLGIAAYFGGPLGALLPLVAAVLRRIYAGGEGIWTGVPQIFAAVLAGLLVRKAFAKKIDAVTPVLVLAALVTLSGTVGFYIRFPVTEWFQVTIATTAPMAVMLFGATLLCGLAIVQEIRRHAATHENTIFRAVIEALPDCLNAKDREGRFIVANPATASLMGGDPAGLIGKTDADYYSQETAEFFRRPELEVLSTGEAVTVEQRFVRSDGEVTWLSTLKAPLFDDDGLLAGVVTHNREITERKKLERELHASRMRLDDAIESMGDGLAMFDADGVLAFHNRRFPEMFPATADVRVPGICMRAIVRASLERGEQAVPETNFEDVVERTAAVLLNEGERLLRLSDGRAIQARTTKTSDHGSMIVFSDVTAHREREERLRELNERLLALASTDSLTGLTNRRAFDDALAKALTQGRKVSLLMVDVDRFKAYNDGYGHLEGDECLKRVAERLAQTFAFMPGTVVARYGGEEFTILLPSVGTDEAQSLASMACNSVRGLAMPHAFSEKGVVTVSIGIACTISGSSRELLKAADAGLYAAKAAGRDCARATPDGVERRQA